MSMELTRINLYKALGILIIFASSIGSLTLIAAILF
jgi:hypothetical protein